ncbi:MAG: hypothetical protein V4819_03920 [Verrucomicrobiota bacterium]
MVYQRADEQKGGGIYQDASEGAVMKDRSVWRSMYEEIEPHPMLPTERKSFGSRGAAPTARGHSANSGFDNSWRVMRG